MKNSIVQLNKNTHAQLKIKKQIDYSIAEDRNLVPVIIHEVSQLATEYPVAFIKNNETGQFVLASLLGLKEGSNLFIKDGNWMGEYIPASLTHYPLNLMINQDDATQYAITIDIDSEIVNESNGEALFDESGEETDYLKQRIEVLKNYYQCQHITKEFLKVITEYDLLEPQNLTYEVSGNKQSISGIYLISEKKLNQLEDSKFLRLKEKGFLSPIYNHLSSLNNIKKLIKLSFPN